MQPAPSNTAARHTATSTRPSGRWLGEPTITGLGIGDDEQEELPEGWQFPAFQRLQHLQMYATPSVSVKASQAYTAVWRWGHNTKRGRDDAPFYDAQETADGAEMALLQAIRGGLAIPSD